MAKILRFMARLLSVLVPLFGVDKDLFTTIVSTKLTTDFRRTKSAGFNANNSKNTFGRQLLAFFFMSFMLGVTILDTDQPEVTFMVLFLILLVLVCTTLLTEFTTVLFNEDENSIFLPRPISSKTLLVSRLGHITLYIFAIVMSFSLIPAVMAGIEFGVITGIMFLISALLTGWVALLITIFCYSILSKFVTGEKFKDVLTYIQIGIGICVFAGYQLILNPSSGSTFASDGLPDVWWIYTLIPVWFAKLSVIRIVPIDAWTWISLALIIITCYWGAKSIINLLSVKFYDIISSVSSTSGTAESFDKPVDGKWSLRRILCISKLEIAGWKLSSTSIKRDRQFKQSIFPVLAYGFISLGMFIMSLAGDSFTQTIENLRNSERFIIFLIPMLFFSLPLSYLRYTRSANASWVFHLIPEDKRHHILTGALKACIVRFFMPPFLILAAMVVFIWGFELLPAFVLGSSATLFIALTGELFNREMPLSLGYDQISKGAMSIRMMLLMLVNGLAYGVVYLLAKIHVGFSIAILPFAILFIALMMRALREK